MNKDLAELIIAYEQEQAELQKEIANYVAEEEFLYAHYSKKSLDLLNDQIAVLKDFQSPYHRHIAAEETMNAHLAKMLGNTTPFPGSWLAIRLQDSERKISEWKEASLKDTYDSQEIDDAIYRLRDGGCKSFKFIFKTAPEVAAAFQIEAERIEITLVYEEDAIDEYRFLLRKLNKLSGLGFQQTNDLWQISYSLALFKDALEIKIMLSRLVYDIFRYDRQYDSGVITYY